jgi:hypothetical protein
MLCSLYFERRWVTLRKAKPTTIHSIALVKNEPDIETTDEC